MLALTWNAPVVTAMLTTADTFISKTSRLYRDTRTAQATGAAGHMERLNEDLQDVTRIMTKNMEDLLWRGDSLDRKYLWIVPAYADIPGMSHLSTSLRSESAKYRKAARNINLEALLRKWAPIGGIGFFFILFIYWRFF